MKTGTKIGLVGLAIGLPALGYWAYTRSGKKPKKNGEDWDDDEPEWDIDEELEKAAEEGLVEKRDDTAETGTPYTRDYDYSWDQGRSFSPYSVRTSSLLSTRR